MKSQGGVFGQHALPRLVWLAPMKPFGLLSYSHLYEHVPNSQLRVLRVVSANSGYEEVGDMSLGLRVG
jgi:hypothetical protein